MKIPLTLPQRGSTWVRKRVTTLPVSNQVHDVSEDEIDVVDEIEDLVSAQNDNNATADETGEENPDGLDFLDNIAQDFDLDEQVGPNIHEKLASIVNNSMVKKLNGEKMKTLMDSYHRPQNCENLVAIKVNPGIWAKMKPETKSKDVKIQKTQGKLFKAAVAMGTVADLLLSAKTKGQTLPWMRAHA